MLTVAAGQNKSHIYKQKCEAGALSNRISPFTKAALETLMSQDKWNRSLQ